MGYYNEMNEVLEQAMSKNFIRENCRELYLTTDDLSALFDYIEAPRDKKLSVSELKDG